MGNTFPDDENAVQKWREDYERDGFFIVPQLFDAEECKTWKREALRVLRESAGPKSTVYVGAAAASPIFYALAGDSRLVAVLRALMPHGVAFLSDKIVFKSGTKMFATPWHFDAAYWPHTRPKLSVWIALDEVREANGALKVLPGSHQRSWQSTGGDAAATNDEFTTVVTPDWQAGDEKVCPLPQGGVIIFADRLLHASCPNTDGGDRYSLISTYHAPGPEEPFDEHFPARHVV
ncbi:MAG TPA: phytanoyl-CoA dioxygenase family protein [Abditibacteriaceae bacterium]|jgi:ectoine hydroxylase-related dioxygenase (phytanoyl-CoA dioxygenase family)